MGKKYCGLILKTAYDSMGETSGIEILGKSMLEWVSLALGSCEWSVAENDTHKELPALVKPYVKPDCDYVVVLYSDTPLITKKTVAEAVEEAYNSSRTVLKMTRGYVFDCAYLMGVDKIYTNDTFYFDEEDFITAFNFKQVGLITDVLKNRILDFHMENGVHFEDLAGTMIGCDVTIERGVTVGAHNVITGKTRIGKNARIGNGNVIRDCIIEEGALVEGSHAVRSLIGKGTKVGPYANLRENNVIGAECEIGDFVELGGCSIGDGCRLAHLSYADCVTMGKDCRIGAGAVLASCDGQAARGITLGDGVTVGASSTVVASVKIGSGAVIEAGSLIKTDVAGVN